jgi:hypothetical protein
MTTTTSPTAPRISRPLDGGRVKPSAQRKGATLSRRLENARQRLGAKIRRKRPPGGPLQASTDEPTLTEGTRAFFAAYNPDAEHRSEGLA